MSREPWPWPWPEPVVSRETSERDDIGIRLMGLIDNLQYQFERYEMDDCTTEFATLREVVRECLR